MIDDEEDAAEVFRMLLESMGHHVETAVGGQDGIDAALAFRPEVIFCDIGMPTVDGYDVARALRGSVELRGAKLVAVSGFAGDAAAKQALQAGFDVHVTKPLKLAMIEQLLAGARGMPVQAEQ